MCGIAGFVGPGTREDLVRMTRCLTDRGPDDEGYVANDGVFLGHRRLSILDLEGGAQPMWNTDATIGIVFNGEIYNFAELREELVRCGQAFRTDHSDTEVLLAAYAEWGDNMVDHLNGMWAFVIHDRKRRRLFGSRDRFGKKPFYYHHAPALEFFAFASELDALLAHPDVPRGINAAAVRKYFAYGYVPAPLAMTDGARKLPGGHCLSLDLASGALRVWRYWDYQPAPEEGGSFAERCEELRGLLAAAVKRRLVADVPVGVFLSGGIDSSLVAALAARELPAGELRTFSIGFDEPTYDELSWADEAARWIGTKHRTETLSLEGARTLLPEIYERLDEPNGDSSLLPTYLLCQFTRREVTVALGGDGGDELFAGYEPFRALRYAALYRRFVPGALHPAITALADRLPVSHRYLSLDFAAKRFVRGAAQIPPLWIPTWMAGMDLSDWRECFRGADPEEVFSEAIEAWDGVQSTDEVEKATAFFVRLYLQESVLAKVDRASMMNGLEVRAPFLDINVANFARKVPSAWRLRGGTTKYLLKEAARGLLPDGIIDRKKKGFGVPVGAWFRDGALRIDPDLMPCPGIARRLQDEHRAGRRNHRLFLWNAWVYGEWKRARMKILVVNYEYPPVGGGGGRVAAQVAVELARRGHEVRVQTSRCGDLPSRQMISGVDVRRVFSFRRKADTCSVPEMAGYVMANAWPVCRAAQSWRPDVIHVHFAVPTGPVAWLAHRLTGIPYVLTAHLGDVPGGAPEQTDHLFRVVKPFTGMIWRDAAAVTAVSTHVASLVDSAYDIEPRIILNGIASRAAAPPNPRPTGPCVFCLSGA